MEEPPPGCAVQALVPPEAEHVDGVDGDPALLGEGLHAAALLLLLLLRRIRLPPADHPRQTHLE